MIDFSEIPVDRLEPAVLIEAAANYRNVGVLPYPDKVLIIGQKLAAGTLAVGSIVQITRADEAVAYFGRGSIGAEMVSFFRKTKNSLPLYVTALADAAAAVKATGTITFVGAVSTASVIAFRIGGRQVRITATPTDTVTSLAAKLATAVNADLDMVATATSALGVVTVTCRHGGEAGNDINLRVDTRATAVPSGLTVNIVAMAGGAGNPQLQTVLDTIDNTWFTNLVTPWADATNLAAAAEWLRTRYLATSKLDCRMFCGKAGTYAQQATLGDITNSAFIHHLGLNKSPSNSWAISAALAGVASQQLNNDPARQLRSLILPGIIAPDAVDIFTDEENDQLLRHGISTVVCLPDGTVTLSRVISTYKLTSLGIADRAWMDIMVPATVSRIRYDWSAYISLMYPRSKLVDDDDAAAFAGRADGDEDVGTAVVTPGRLLASWAARCKLYGEKVWIEDVKRTVKESVIERNGDDRNRVDARLQIKIVGNMMVFAGRIEFQV